MTVSSTGIGTETPSVPKDESSTPIAQAAPLLIPVRTSPPLTNSSDVSQIRRDEKAEEVKTKFHDVFAVNTDCERFFANLDEYSDEVNVKGRLHTDAKKFFEHIGASNFVLNTLKNGHHPRLKKPVPDFEFKNNASF